VVTAVAAGVMEGMEGEEEEVVVAPALYGG